MHVRGIIFDLDGTLIDSRLDFAAIRRDLGLSDGELILESLNAMPAGSRKDECLAILRQHELRGAECATLMPGVADFLSELKRRGVLAAVLTRNSTETTTISLKRLGLEFSQVLTRDDVPAKPDPTGPLRICKTWQFAPEEVLLIGDFLFDLQAGRNAGIRTVLYAPGEIPDYADEADFMLRHFDDAADLIDSICRK